MLWKLITQAAGISYRSSLFGLPVLYVVFESNGSGRCAIGITGNSRSQISRACAASGATWGSPGDSCPIWLTRSLYSSLFQPPALSAPASPA